MKDKFIDGSGIYKLKCDLSSGDVYTFYIETVNC